MRYPVAFVTAFQLTATSPEPPPGYAWTPDTRPGTAPATVVVVLGGVVVVGKLVVVGELVVAGAVVGADVVGELEVVVDSTVTDVAGSVATVEALSPSDEHDASTKHPIPSAVRCHCRFLISSASTAM